MGKLGAGVETLASAPRKGVAYLASKLKNVGEGAGASALTGQVVGTLGGIPGLLELGIAEGIGLMAKRIGGSSGQLLRILAQPASNKRFLYRIATSDKVPKYQRQLALVAYRGFGTSGGDAAFNMLANGITIGGINAGLAGMAGEDARGSGAAFGAGLAAGGVLPFGQPGRKAGKSDIARDSKSIDLHMKNKLTEMQRQSFKKLPKPAQVLLATLDEAEVGSPKVTIIEPKLYLETLNKERAEAENPLLDRAPAGHFDKTTRTIFLNESNMALSLIHISEPTRRRGIS